MYVKIVQTEDVMYVLMLFIMVNSFSVLSSTKQCIKSRAMLTPPAVIQTSNPSITSLVHLHL